MCLLVVKCLSWVGWFVPLSRLAAPLLGDDRRQCNAALLLAYPLYLHVAKRHPSIPHSLGRRDRFLFLLIAPQHTRL